MGRFARGALLGLLLVLAAGVWPAAAAVDTGYTKVTAPAANSVLQGHYDSDGSPIAFKHTIRGQAKSTCSSGFSWIRFSITGPSDYTLTFPSMSSGNSTWSGGPSSPWDTRPLERNGIYSVRLTVTDNNSLLCNGNTFQTKNDVKVANAPETPAWEGAPAAAPDGSARVTLKWKKNPEKDIVFYHMVRSGPDGTSAVPISPNACGSGGCSWDDTAFAADYSGTYSYHIVAYRSAPSETGQECGSVRCVKSADSGTKSVTLTKPTPSPSPSPTDSPTGGGSSPPSSGGSNNGGGGSTTGPSTRRGGTSVLSFGGSSGGGGASFNEFYSGTYQTNLPYEPKTLVIGGGRTTAPNGRQVEAAALSNEPPNYRTIMLPVAGGLLAFLSAAHVRRLLIHF